MRPLLSLLGLFALLFTSASLAQEATTPPAETAANASEELNTSVVESSVVRIFTTAVYPDIVKPWTKQPARESTGSGVVIEGKRILTNAHVVSYASQVQVQANQSGDKLSATVEFIAPGIDLAVLKLDDEDDFFDTHPPLARANTLPMVKDTVIAYGYPTGGSSLSITKGIVSRIEFTPYNYPTSGLRIQIDAAINPGNSGGPALVGDKMVGLAFSMLGGAQNIGYIIPCEEIEIFLKDIADGNYDGKPAMFDRMQTFENTALRGFLKLDKNIKGMIINEPDDSDAAYPLKRWDVITKIGDTPVDEEGMVKISANLRLRFAYLIQHTVKDGKVPLTIVRDGKEISLQMPLQTSRPRVIPELNGGYPTYFIFGPLVFSPATGPLVGAMLANSGSTNALTFSGSPLIKRRGDKPDFEGEELVIIPSPFFPHRLVKGYSQPFGRVVDHMNGIKVKNLHHLVEILRDSKDEFVVFDFAGMGEETLVFPRKAMIDETEEILNTNGVRAQGSPDVMRVWNAKPAGS